MSGLPTKWPTCPVCKAGPDEACTSAATHDERVQLLVDEVERSMCSHVGCSGRQHGKACPAQWLPGRTVGSGGAR